MSDTWTRGGSSPREVPLTALGVPVDVVVSGDRADQLVSAMVAPWAWSKRTGAERAGEVEPGNPVRLEVVAEATSDIDQLLHQLSTDVTVAAIERRAGELWMLHAACLVHPGTGAAVALVAASGTGKTTAATRLGRTLGYLTDETTAVDRSGRVMPHPKPLSLVQDGPLKLQAGPGDLGLRSYAGPATLKAVVLLERDGTVVPTLEPVPLGEALVRLAEQTSYLARLERPLHFMADVLAGTAGVQRARYAEVDDLLPLLTALLEAS